jgi:hypothetical protein
MQEAAAPLWHRRRKHQRRCLFAAEQLPSPGTSILLTLARRQFRLETLENARVDLAPRLDHDLRARSQRALQALCAYSIRRTGDARNGRKLALARAL